MFLRSTMRWPAAGFAPPARPRREQLFPRNCPSIDSAATLARSRSFDDGSRWTRLAERLVSQWGDCMAPSGRDYYETVQLNDEGTTCFLLAVRLLAASSCQHEYSVTRLPLANCQPKLVAQRVTCVTSVTWFWR